MRSYFDNYWEIKHFKGEIKENVCKKFIKTYPLLNYDRPSEAHRLWLDCVLSSEKVLDFEAGDLRFKKFALRNNFRGKYHTLDIGKDFNYDFSHLDNVKEKFDLILCFEVIEHMDLGNFLNVLPKLKERLRDGGKLIITTPNIHHINHFWKADVTHIRHILTKIYTPCYGRADSKISRCIDSYGGREAVYCIT